LPSSINDLVFQGVNHFEAYSLFQMAEEFAIILNCSHL